MTGYIEQWGEGTNKILKRSKYKLLKEAEDTFVDFINRNWLTGENKPKMAEYYLIGTLASITFALLVGIVVRAILVGGV